MNLLDFISKLQYDDISIKCINHSDFKFTKSVVTNYGNRYSLYISQFYTDSEEYKVFCWIDYNYKDDRGDLFGNTIGGGDIDFIPNDWENFKLLLNERLSKFPDYDELIQMSLFY